MSAVLVVDDRVLDREFLASLLRFLGHRVLVAGDGEEALALVADEPVRLVICDLLLPAIDAEGFAGRLCAAAGGAIPIIFMTAAHRLDEARPLAARCGVAALLGKPAEPQAIIDAVQAALGEPGADTAAAPLPPQLHELVGLQQRLQHALEAHEPDGGIADPLRRASDRLMLAYGTVQALSLRLAAVLEFGLRLVHERDPDRLLRLAGRAGQQVLNARFAGLCIDLDGRRPWRFAGHGFDDATERAIAGALQPDRGLLGRVARERRIERINDPLSPSEAGLPDPHPPLDNLLAVPLSTGGGTVGWFYLAGKNGGGDFTEDDARLAATLAAQLAPAYENLMLFDEVQQYAGQLEAEIVERKFAAARLGESEQRFRQLAEAINEAFFLVAPAKQRLLYLSPAYKRIWGRSRARLYARLDSWLDDVHPDDRARAERELLLAQPPGQFDSEFRILRPDGAVRWVKVCGFPVEGPDGRLLRIAGTASDITERREHERGIARLTRIHAVLSGINSAIVRIRDRDELLQEACRIAVEHGLFRAAWIGQFGNDDAGQVLSLRSTDPEFGPRIAFSRSGDHPAARALRERRPVVLNEIASASALQHGGEFRDCQSVAAFPIDIDGAPRLVLVLCAAEPDFFDEQEVGLLRELAGDIGFGLQYIAKEEGLAWLALYDPLTGLANGRLFIDRVNQFIATARPNDENVALMVLDLERFTQINDSLGRQVGDALLRLVADRLSRTLEEPCSLARIAADTFAIAVTGLRNRADVARLLKNDVLRAIELPFSVDGTELRLSARVGIAIFPSDGDDAAALFKNAEAALKQTQAGGQRFVYYAPRMNAEVAEKLALEARLRQAFELGQFVLHYQPKLDAARRIVGFEALARWCHPERGIIEPALFIPLLEESGMILEFGEWALRQALTDYREWQAAGLDPPPVAVNVSALQLHRPDFADRVLAAIAEAGVGAEALEIEVTESLLMQDIEAGTRSLRRLREAGICISIDDFGTGYSSLRYLAKLPLDSLKIDRSFVVTMLDDDSSMAIVSMVISLAHALELSVIAEGVDDRSQARALRRMGCNEMQGFLFSRPVSARDAAGLLERANAA